MTVYQRALDTAMYTFFATIVNQDLFNERRQRYEAEAKHDRLVGCRLPFFGRQRRCPADQVA
jgi:hypothetical protein